MIYFKRVSLLNAEYIFSSTHSMSLNKSATDCPQNFASCSLVTEQSRPFDILLLSPRSFPLTTVHMTIKTRGFSKEKAL